ncbi:transposase, IS605 OrfB family [Stanieria cyanosphaera PCC 7437]|uniref:Transposase, IS605 OrfB family n=1 Tax=Stanieria cyanosphaera (strain ATCC 29371 / PCC 7437) TaxID=111780 RepID=K9XVK1_STAC7|nr:RNA-guided endonuclease TnpB family protein [Stanieria cyanosphaera]AFZ35702.1 transposase, IS605 OrfB family [Stanieria cyanosphaera PCC 7437]
MYGCQQVLVTQDKNLINVLTFLCEESHKLINMGIFYARQLYFKAKKIIGKFDLIEQYKTNYHYKILHSQAAQQILLSVAESFKSYKGLVKAFKEGEITDKPRIPNYRKKGGLATISYPKQALKLKDNKLRVPLGKTCKRWFGIDSFKISMPSNLNFSDIKELRILPRNKCFYFEFVYEKQTQKAKLNRNNVLGIDPGLNNWLTCVSNVETSFIVDGKHLKSMNRWYNKQVAKIKQNKPQGFWNKKLAAITEKRNRQMRDAINKAARIVIDHCLENRIGIIVFGWNKGNKKEIELGKKNNSEFVPIPTARLKDRIEQLCLDYGIEFVETEESYTSKASFLDGDNLPKYGEKPKVASSEETSEACDDRKDWKPSGKRTKRGLYRVGYGQWYINADCNGAANIIRKVSRTLGLELNRLSRGVLTRPQRLTLWSVNKEALLPY